MKNFVAGFAFLLTLSCAHGQSSRHVFKGFADAGAAYANRMVEHQMALERIQLEGELARQRALESLREIRHQEQRAAQDPDPEMRAMTMMHPQWMRIVSSTAFEAWLRGPGLPQATLCRTAQKAAVLASCIDAFLGPTYVSR